MRFLWSELHYSTVLLFTYRSKFKSQANTTYILDRWSLEHNPVWENPCFWDTSIGLKPSMTRIETCLWSRWMCPRSTRWTQLSIQNGGSAIKIVGLYFTLCLLERVVPQGTKYNVRRTLSSENFIAAYYSMFLDSDAISNASTFNLQRYVTHQIKWPNGSLVQTDCVSSHLLTATIPS